MDSFTVCIMKRGHPCLDLTIIFSARIALCYLWVTSAKCTGKSLTQIAINVLSFHKKGTVCSRCPKDIAPVEGMLELR